MACPDCFRGGVTSIEPTGSFTTIHGRRTYVAEPADGAAPRGLIVFITDAFGVDFVNNRVLCDVYAKKGNFLVYCPDFMNGYAMDPKVIKLMDTIMAKGSWYDTLINKPKAMIQAMPLVIPWYRNTKIPDTHPGIVSFLQAVRTSPLPFPTPDLKIGVAGFCWGGKHAMLLARSPPASHVARPGSSAAQPLIDCAWMAHPSFLEVPADGEAAQVPTAIVVGADDMVLKKPDAEKLKQVLEAKGDGFEVTILTQGGAAHGFAVRTHPDNKEEMDRAAEAEEMALKWFGRWLGA
ncbi:hypothetical protein S40285_05088 [Stachybotrys chlorohalonatus IBT 40285]|uniref:Dienelactone hydrolase domain-containing protein n=1 Tax=Stachybotrys chlorohalonatus (strain IBT 40285) TaxID=1283841 RepID=A0A084QQI1_STAC4|nr:hypothetical protein S40285_05088 [Stachybotrys chlorohalonata IBT 40285]